MLNSAIYNLQSAINMRLVPLAEAHARQIVGWRYAPPYDFYNHDGDDEEEVAEAVEALLNPAYHYYAVLNEQDELLAYRCFGPDAQVPGGDYRAAALDMGGGLRPDLTGQGLGPQVMQAAMAFARAHFNPPAFRVTVAAWNGRALRACEKVGYRQTHTFTGPDGTQFVILIA